MDTLVTIIGGKYMFYEFTEEQLRSFCRTNIESLEKWARLIVDIKLTEKYGNGYFNVTNQNGEPLIKKDIREKATKMLSENPTRFKSEVDTLFLDEILYILCKRELYNACFKDFLDISYPDGSDEARTFLSRLIPIRNKLSHSNPISIRDAEQCVCYCNDFVSGVKEYFKNRGDEQMYNVPNAIKLTDSLGNEYSLNKNISFQNIQIIDKSTNQLQKFNVGDRYSAWLTLDPSFPENQYIFRWNIEGGEVISTKSRIDLEISEKLIRERMAIYCTIVSTNSWHRYSGYDQQFAINFQVLPPMR